MSQNDKVRLERQLEMLVNRTQNGWTVTLLNPAGQLKPQQGIFPTDFRENRRVTIKSRLPIQSATDRLLSDERLVVQQNAVQLEVPAGAARVIELE